MYYIHFYIRIFLRNWNLDNSHIHSNQVLLAISLFRFSFFQLLLLLIFFPALNLSFKISLEPG